MTGAMKSCHFIPMFALISLAACHGIETHRMQKSFYRVTAEEAAVYGDVSGMYSLGMAYLEGRDGSMDYPEGAKWVCLAARKGHVPAQVSIAEFYENQARKYPIAPSSDDLSATPGYDMLAYAWYTVAMRNGDLGSQGKRKDVMEDFNLEATHQAIAIADAFPDSLCEYPPKGVVREDRGHE